MWKYLKGVPPPKKRKADDEKGLDNLNEHNLILPLVKSMLSTRVLSIQ